MSVLQRWRGTAAAEFKAQISGIVLAADPILQAGPLHVTWNDVDLLGMGAALPPVTGGPAYLLGSDLHGSLLSAAAAIDPRTDRHHRVRMADHALWVLAEHLISRHPSVAEGSAEATIRAWALNVTPAVAARNMRITAAHHRHALLLAEHGPDGLITRIRGERASRS
jgi:hypothetical protein